MEANQVDVIAAAVSCRLEQVRPAAETGLSREIVGDIPQMNRRNRIHDDVPVVHGVTTARLDVRPSPDANAALDPSAPNSLAKTFGEHHDEHLSDGRAS